MTHTDLLRQALDALELQEPAVGCPREREHWKRTAMPTIAALRAALAAPVEPVRELLIQAAALAVVAERQGKYPGAAQVADEVLKAQPAIDGFGGNLDEMFDAPAVPADGRKLCTCDGAGRGPGRACVVQAGGRLGDLWKCAKSAAPAVLEPHEPYLCIKPACGPDCSGCNCAISPQDMRDYAVRYAILRNAPINAIRDGGVFAGKTPDNVVINGEHLDAAVDALRGITGDSR